MSPVPPNGTHAGEIARHFVKVTGIRVTSPIMGKTTNQAKSLLDAGYTKGEIVDVINHLVKSVPDMYSLGYLSYHMERALREIAKERTDEENRRQQEELKKAQEEEAKPEEVIVDDASKERNRLKAERLRASVQSREREKFNFDMFEE